MKTHPTFDAWAQAQLRSQRPAIDRLRNLVADVAPKLIEVCKWGNGCWLKGELPLLFLHAKDDHLQFGFFGGALLADPDRLLTGKGKYVRHIRVQESTDIQEELFSTMVRRAVRAPNYKSSRAR